ncbi:c-type cytochrome domain-containing protein [Verrucomicrobiales bacterium BCK34]|nr:c-type cytochrome domain-containing protein [Verrucomicrobiales bacterium BCK34]
MKGLGTTLLLFAAFVQSGSAVDPDPLAILNRECVSCHSESKQKGGLLIESQESLIKGGDTDAAIVPGKAAESYLVELLYPDADSHMPPKSQLDPREILAIEKWINDGAKWDSAKWASLQLPEKREVKLAALPDTYTPVLAMAISPDGKTLAVGQGSRIDWYAITKPDEKKEAWELKFRISSTAHSDAVQSLTFSDDGKTLASGGFRSLLLWKVAEPAKAPEKLEAPFLGRQTALVFLDSPPRILAADSLPSQLGRLHEIDLKSKKVKTFDTAHLDSIYALSRSHSGKFYATASSDKLVTIRDSQTHKITTRLEGHTGYVLAASFSPEDDRIATGGDDEEIKVWDLESGKKTGSFSSSRSGPVYGLSWKSDPANLKKKTEEKDPEKAKAVNTDRIFSVFESGKPAAFTELKEHEGEQRSTGAKERSFDTVSTNLFAMAVHPAKQWLVAGGENGKIFLWDENGKLKQTVEVPNRNPELANTGE